MSSQIESVLTETRVFPPSADFVRQANISGMDAYRKMCAEAEKDFEGFWAKLAREHVLWHKPFTKTLDESKAPFFRWFAKEESREESIEELVVAAGLLSQQRVGAIIAVERQVGMRTYIDSGIALDAVLTYDLLLAIFQPKSPLHDGAAIVQNDRVAAAACFLPLTVNQKLSKTLGSRHRAAVGVTEESDAVALVVSEETGGISIVVFPILNSRSCSLSYTPRVLQEPP